MGGVAGQLKQKNIDKNWQMIQNEGCIEIYCNIQDGTIAQKRSIMIDPIYSLENQMLIYNYRRYNNDALVKTYDIEDFDSENSKRQKNRSIAKMCSQSYRLNVLSERIQYRLSELPQLTFPESLHILREASKGYQVIYQKIGGCHITPELIGLNDKGQVKVWVNENWALNHPSRTIPTLISSSSSTNCYDLITPELRDQSEMIENLIDVIQNKTEEGRFSGQFNANLRDHCTNFKKLNKFLFLYINQQNKEYIPQLIKKSRVLMNPNQINKYKKQKFKSIKQLSSAVNQYDLLNKNQIIKKEDKLQKKLQTTGYLKTQNFSQGSSNHLQFNTGRIPYNFNQGIKYQNSKLKPYELTFGKDSNNLFVNQNISNRKTENQFDGSHLKTAKRLVFEPKSFTDSIDSSYFKNYSINNRPESLHLSSKEIMNSIGDHSFGFKSINIDPFSQDSSYKHEARYDIKLNHSVNEQKDLEK